MENENEKLVLAPALRAIKEQIRKPDEGRLIGMKNDWNGIRLFLIGGFHHDGLWPAGTLSIRCDADEILVTLSIHSLEIESKYRFDGWDQGWETINGELEQNRVCWQMDWKGRDRMNRRMSMS
jgi:hypothetical protein